MRRGDGEGNVGDWQRGEEMLSEAEFREKEGGWDGERRPEMVGWLLDLGGGRWREDEKMDPGT